MLRKAARAVHHIPPLLRLLAGASALILIVSLFAAQLAPYDPYATDPQLILQPPSAAHPCGTDNYGRDLLSRILFGARTSICAALLIILVAATGGSLIGLLAGFFRGRTDALLMRIVDIVQAFPSLILAIAVAGILGGGLTNAMLALMLTTWTQYARLARSLTLKVKQQDYLAAAITNGTRQADMIRRHILPNILPIIIVTAALDIGALMMELAGLSFLGFGAQPPTPEWGLMLNEGRQLIQTAPWLMIFPGLAIASVVAIFNLWGDSLRDMMDPRKAN